MTAQFSILHHDQKWLVVKTVSDGSSLVVATCYLETYAKIIRDLLQKEENEK